MSKKPSPLESFNDGVKSMLDQRNAALAECERWRREAMAARVFVDKLKETESDHRYIDVWLMYAIHVGTYEGPNCADELTQYAAARSANDGAPQ